MENQALAKIESPEHEMSVVRREVSPLSVTQVSAGLRAINEVMAQCMKDGQDYGKVPGCGDKPGLFQPGAQKLSMMFQLNPAVQQEIVTDYPNFHRGYRIVVRVTNGAKFADGVGECSTMEAKYRYRNTGKKCPECGKETVLKSKKDDGWFCWGKKGGCGKQFPPGSEGLKNIMSQSSGKTEHDNPPDYWNTVRKMAFKRAFVHAIINATNTSELWSQDLEDLRDNGVVGDEPTPSAPAAAEERPLFDEAAPKKSATAPRADSIKLGNVVTCEVNFLDYREAKSKPDATKPWVAWFCSFEDANGQKIEAGTFDKKISESLEVLKGNLVQLTYKPGKKAGTFEICTIEPATVPF